VARGVSSNLLEIGKVSLILGATNKPWDESPLRDGSIEKDPVGEPVTNVIYLAQNWSPSQSLQFYFNSQGSQVLPYD
jgi:hypothetical protein